MYISIENKILDKIFIPQKYLFTYISYINHYTSAFYLYKFSLNIMAYFETNAGG